MTYTVYRVKFYETKPSIIMEENFIRLGNVITCWRQTHPANKESKQFARMAGISDDELYRLENAKELFETDLALQKVLQFLKKTYADLQQEYQAQTTGVHVK